MTLFESEAGPGRAKELPAERDRSTLLTIDRLTKAGDTSISVLLELKMFPALRSAQFRGIRDDQRENKPLVTASGDNIVVAFGINLEVPGEYGIGFGEEWPLKSLAPSSILNWMSSKWPHQQEIELEAISLTGKNQGKY